MQKRFPWLIVLIILLGTYFLWRILSQPVPAAAPPEVVPTATAVPTPTPFQNQPEAKVDKAFTGLEQIYYNSEGDFSLLLPVDWLANEAESTPLGNQYTLSSEAGSDSRILITAADTTQEAVLAQVMCAGCEVKAEKEIILQNSQVASQRISLKGPNLVRDVEWFFIHQGDKLVVLSINNPKTHESLEAIIHSFTPGQLTDVGIEALVAVQAARIHLAGQSGVDPLNVVVQSMEAHEWNNTCMGIALPQELCQENVPTKGYIMKLRLGGQLYDYQVREDGTLAAPEFPFG